MFGGIKNYFSSKNAAAGGGNSTQVRVSNTSAYANGNASSNVASNAPYNSSGLNGFEVTYHNRMNYNLTYLTCVIILGYNLFLQFLLIERCRQIR